MNRSPTRAGTRSRQRGRRRVLLALAALVVFSQPFSQPFAQPVAATDAGQTDRGAATTSLIEQAIERYTRAMETGERDERIALFGESERLFRAAVESGARSADLETNRGNAALQAEHLGGAILAYRRALWLDPGNERARRNLAHARDLLPDAIPKPSEGGFADTFFFWHDRASAEQVQSVAALCFALAAALFGATLLRRIPGLRVVAGFLLAIWGALMVSIAFDPRGDGSEAGVVTVADAIPRAADSINAPRRFSQPLPAGTELRILEDRGDWLQIELQDGRSAWLVASAVTRVADEAPVDGDPR
jgi:tetratricopeptide (TPR) repeat protein